MSEKKIAINPEFFSVNGRKTRNTRKNYDSNISSKDNKNNASFSLKKKSFK